jgi:hypothetical protein
MTAEFQILGVHHINAKEPCRLIDVLITNYDDEFDWVAVTQEVPGQPRDNWKAVYDEQLIERKGDSAHFVFFFHFLDFSKPLITPFGPVILPKPSRVPSHLKKIKYYPTD